MGAFISWSAYGSLVSVGCTQGLNIILNLFFGPAVNAARGVSVQVQHAVSLFTSNFQIAINPQITKAVAVNDYNESKKLLVASTKISFFLLCIIGIPIISGADWILSLWLKEVPAHSVNFVRIMLIICIFQSIANPLRIVNQAEGNIKKFQLYECSYLLLILPLSYLCLRIGTEPEIVFIVQLAIEITAQLIRAKIVLPKIQMSGTDYLFKVYCPICFSFLVSLGVVAILNRYLVNSVFCQLVGLIVVEMAVLHSFFIFGFNKTERKFLFNFAKKRFLRKK